MDKLTIKQKQLLEAIEYFININGYSPTISELAELTKTSTSPTFYKLLKLEEKGYISTSNCKTRTIKILKRCDDEI